MDCKVGACAKCIQRCSQIHAKKTSSPPVTSFFKVMMGDECSDILYLPPKFASTMSTSIDQETLLKDSTGQQWKVRISDEDGSLAFRQGWNVFSLDHGLELGDFIVFNYMIGSHFTVKIYDKTCCETVNPSKNNNHKKRTWSNSSSAACCNIDKNSKKNSGLKTSVVSGSNVEISQCPRIDVQTTHTGTVMYRSENCEKKNEGPRMLNKEKYIEEPYFLIDRDLEGKVEGERSARFDLFTLEMCRNKSETGGTQKVVRDEKFPHHIDSGLGYVDPVTKVMPSCPSENEIIEKSNSFRVMDKKMSVSDKYSSCCDNATGKRLPISILEKTKKTAKDVRGLSDKAILSNTPPSRGLKNKVKKEPGDITQVVCTDKEIIAETRESKINKEEHIQKIIKVERNQISDTILEDNNVHEVIKAKFFDSFGNTSPSTASVSCVVENRQSFLELPISLPSCFDTNTILERKVVLLRDPRMRLWPVLYHEQYGMKALTSGWEAFSKANDIKQGDECIFQVENVTSAHIYQVSIRKL